MKTCWNLLLLLSCLLAFPTLGVSQAPVPVGSQFTVNSYTTYSQSGPVVSMNTAGNFVVVWTHHPFQGGFDVFGRLFSADGTPMGDDFQVHSYTTSTQWEPSVSMDPDGNFVVVWSGFLQDGHGSGVFGQRFASNGTPAGPEFRVPTVTAECERLPSVAMKSNGDFVVVWDNCQDVFGQQFMSDGTPIGTEFLVNSFTTNGQTDASVATDSNGNFVAVWQSKAQDGSGTTQDNNGIGIFGQRFASDGSPLGTEFQVKSAQSHWLLSPRIASDPLGNFVVVWEDPVMIAGACLTGRRFSSDGTPLGGEFQVGSELSPYIYSYASIASDQDGNFVVVWHNDGIDAQAFSSDGTPLTPQMDVSREFVLHNTPWNTRPSIAMNPAGEFVIAWSEPGGAYPYGDDIVARRFRLAKESDELAADFGSNGLWYHDGATWKKPTGWNPEDLEAWQDRLAVDFGAGRGIYLYDQSGWHQITAWDPYELVAWGDKLLAAFDAGRGVYLYDTTTKWAKLTSWEPVRVVAWGDRLACDFGPGRGLYVYDGTTWSPITTWTTTHLVALWDDLVAAFDSNGLWIYQQGTGWTQLHSWQPAHMAAWANSLVVAFGSGRGIWHYNFGFMRRPYNPNGWRQISAWDPYLLVPWRGRIAAAFDGGRGTYLYDSTTWTWTKKTNWEPVGMKPLAGKLVVDFGSGRGIYTYDTGWLRMTAWTAEQLEAANLTP